MFNHFDMVTIKDCFMDYGFGHGLIFTFINVLNNPSLITNSIIHTSYVLLKYYHCEYTLLQFEKTLFFFELLSSFCDPYSRIIYGFIN